jgi:hypothetical protein
MWKANGRTRIHDESWHGVWPGELKRCGNGSHEWLGRRFKSTVVRGKTYAFLCCVLSWTWYDWECIFLECLRGGESLSLLLTATLSWKIVYIMKRCASLRRTSRLRHLRCCSMSPTLDVLPWLLVTYLAVLCLGQPDPT